MIARTGSGGGRAWGNTTGISIRREKMQCWPLVPERDQGL
jgi:hypothetical protein